MTYTAQQNRAGNHQKENQRQRIPLRGHNGGPEKGRETEKLYGLFTPAFLQLLSY